MNWTFHITEHWEDIWNEDYQRKWLDLLNASPNSHIFFHPSLIKAWVETYIPLRKISPVFIWGEFGDNEVFFPLILWHKNWKNAFLKVIVPAGYSDFDYHDPIFKYKLEKNHLQSFWIELHKCLNRYQYDEILLDGLHCSLPGFIKDSNEICPYLDLSGMLSDNDLINFFSTSLRGDIRRQIRRMNELGSLNYHEYESFDDAKDTFQEFILEHTKKWPNAYKAPFFHENLLKTGLGSIVHFSSLNIDNIPISWHLGFEFAGTYYYYMPAGKKSYSKYSPVKIHLYFLIKRAIENKYTKYDHLRGDEAYKQGWASGSDSVMTYHFKQERKVSELKFKILEFRRFLYHN